MKTVDLEANIRERTGKAEAKKVRITGRIPAIIYGKKIKAYGLDVDFKLFRKAISTEAGLNAIINLKVAGGKENKPIPVITKDIQYDYLTGQILHVDFHQLILDEKIEAEVRVELTGIARGVKEDGGILIHGSRTVKVKCLPLEIPANFTVDITPLKISDMFHVSDLQVAKGIEIISPPDEILATVEAPRKEEEVAAPAVTEAEVLAAPPAEGEAGAKAEDKAAPSKAPTEKAGAPKAPTDKAAAPKAAAPAAGKPETKK